MASSCICRQRQCLLCDALMATDDRRSHQQVCEIRGMIRKQVYRPREMLFQQGMNADQLFVLKHGLVKLTASLPDGRTQGLGLAPPWGLLGVQALGAEHYPCTAEAAGDVQVCTIRQRDMLQVMEANPALARRLIGQLNQELRRTMAQVRSIGVMSAIERIAALLLSVDMERGEGLELPLSRTDMAEILGLTVETVSRIISRLRRDGILEAPSSRRLRILDYERLFALSCDGQSAPVLDCA